MYLYCGGWIVWLDRGDFCDAEVTPLMDVPAYRARGTTADDNATQSMGLSKLRTENCPYIRKALTINLTLRCTYPTSK